MAFPDKCECSQPGPCKVAGRVMTPGLLKECQTNHAFRLRLATVPVTDKANEAAKALPANTPPPPARVSLPCIHRSATPVEWASCGCHVFDCEVHERCVPWRKQNLVDGVKVCDECHERVATHPSPPGQFTRHLLYHIYPLSGNGVWQSNVRQLCERLHVINGKRIVAIVVDPPDGRKPDPTGPNAPDRGRVFAPCDSPDAVKAAFGAHANDIDFIIVENDPRLREVKPFHAMMERLPRGISDVTLYAQAKGVTRRKNHIAHHWARVLYIIYFDYWPIIDRQLRAKPVTGAFRKLGAGWSREVSTSQWHYSGSWFWFRNADLFARDWRRIDQFWSGIEPYPSQHFTFDETDCLFMEGVTGSQGLAGKMNLYSPDYWRTVVNPAFAQWRSDNAHLLGKGL